MKLKSIIAVGIRIVGVVAILYGVWWLAIAVALIGSSSFVPMLVTIPLLLVTGGFALILNSIRLARLLCHGIEDE